MLQQIESFITQAAAASARLATLLAPLDSPVPHTAVLQIKQLAQEINAALQDAMPLFQDAEGLAQWAQKLLASEPEQAPPEIGRQPVPPVAPPRNEGVGSQNTQVAAGTVGSLGSSPVQTAAPVAEQTS